MTVNNQHLIDQKDMASGLQGSHPNGVTCLFKGKCCYHDNVKHDIKSVRRTGDDKLPGPWFVEE